MRLLILCAGLFLAGAVFNVVRGDYQAAGGGVALSSLMAGVFVLLRREEQKAVEFLTWVLRNKMAIVDDLVAPCYKGVPITLDTRVTRFQACFSFLIVTTSSYSRYYVKGRHHLFAIGLLYTLVTCVFGWWGLPHGPIQTLQTLFRNLRGGHQHTVRDVLRDSEKL